MSLYYDDDDTVVEVTTSGHQALQIVLDTQCTRCSRYDAGTRTEYWHGIRAFDLGCKDRLDPKTKQPVFLKKFNRARKVDCYQKVPCDSCNGTGRMLTDSGRTILDFVKKHLKA